MKWFMSDYTVYNIMYYDSVPGTWWFLLTSWHFKWSTTMNYLYVFVHTSIIFDYIYNEQLVLYIDGLGHKPFKSGQAFFSERW